VELPEGTALITGASTGIGADRGLPMGEVIQFVSKPERERIRLIREARAIYDSVFPPANPVNEQSKAASGHAIHGGELVP
jgi:hypothetical protein